YPISVTRPEGVVVKLRSTIIANDRFSVSSVGSAPAASQGGSVSTAEGSPVQDASFGYTGRDPSETLVLAALESVDDLEPRRYVVEHNVAKRELDVVSLEEAAERRGLASMRISPEIRVFHDG